MHNAGARHKWKYHLLLHIYFLRIQIFTVLFLSRMKSKIIFHNASQRNVLHKYYLWL
ncbi:hypothetical protein ECSTECMHI813_0913 [Escherichia coli STEC_MHI813]|nr:hypothetical protein ECSTECMHI813_0913 [Escherichia coli STEC_MHI813]